MLLLDLFKNLVSDAGHHGDVGGDKVEVEDLRQQFPSVLPLIFFDGDDPLLEEGVEDLIDAHHLGCDHNLFCTGYLLDKLGVHGDYDRPIENITDNEVVAVVIVLEVVGGISLQLGSLDVTLKERSSEWFEVKFLHLEPVASEG